MRNIFLYLLFILISVACYGQKSPFKSLDRSTKNKTSTLNARNFSNRDSLGLEELEITYDKKAKPSDYKIFNLERDTVFVDTTLSINKEYKLNFLRKDLFKMMPFHNLGQTMNTLSYDFESNQGLHPFIGFLGKQYNIIKPEEVSYYNVATPTTEIMYRSGLEQGQVLHSMIAVNLTPNLNFSLAYRGIRSLGKYRQALSSHGNFTFTTNYASTNSRYHLQAHIVTQDLTNQENGGLTTESVDYFETNNEEYIDRARLETNYTDAESLLVDKRYFLQQEYVLWKKGKDSVNSSLSELSIGHTIQYDTKHFKFTQTTANTFIGDAYQNSIYDRSGERSFQASVYSTLNAPYVLGRLKFGLGYSDYTYRFSSYLVNDALIIPSKIAGDIITANASWDAALGSLKIKAKANTILSGDITGASFNGEVSYAKDSLFIAKGLLRIEDKAPNLNTQIYQSDYVAYNWYNPDFKNIQTRKVGGEISFAKYGNLHADYTQIDNYTYFDMTSSPVQEAATVNYFRAGFKNGFTYKKFSLENTFLYQKVLDGETVLKVPNFITRNTLYYSDHWFKGDPLFIQIGATLKYFGSYEANEYDPVIGEFRLQEAKEIGNYPLVDIFVNGQIRRTRLYFKAENVTSGFTGRDYFASPTQPYRDFIIRFGLVWNFFI